MSVVLGSRLDQAARRQLSGTAPRVRYILGVETPFDMHLQLTYILICLNHQHHLVALFPIDVVAAPAAEKTPV